MPACSVPTLKSLAAALEAALEAAALALALASLAEWFQIYNNYDWGGDMYNIDGSHGLRIHKAEDGTETYELVDFDDL